MTFSIKKLSFDGKRFIQKPPPLKRSGKCFVAACAALALGMACNAQANVWITPSPVDTITTLVINWGWDSAGGTETYFGKSWNATITTTEVGSTWTVNTWYQHLDGPHGEAPEPMHSHSISFLEPDGGSSANGVEDHDVLQHVGFHQWSLAGNAMGSTGVARLEVLHPIPEPESWALMAAGLGVFVAGRRKLLG
ncbi:PEP-CTERM sorting domain-containing protein [Paucibacter sp. TC2R-5]|uniref:PEP-CTERM sorting domain-containing protein n=1 Tax=Paucibacter sp. TC2R-5 TaxID=2893555 RepID=UPI0021E445F5|nr:PEP-CTERM sorting domain-containing protein [Paucibacter sp. TC2R-5]MCV2358058.1 PEP-CTERM sorting domain-containing protein [Paucibacter sp. TC2R-5]